MKTYTTEQVWRLLEKHPTWTFAAPDCDEWVAMSAFTSNTEGRPCIRYLDIFKYKIGDIDRSDWVRTNKPKPIRIDKVTGVSNIGLWLDKPTNIAEEIVTGQGSWVPTNPDKTYKVYLVECD